MMGAIQRAKKRLRPLYVAFIDVRKAFDSVSHQTMLLAAKRMGMPGPLLEYLAEFYKGAGTAECLAGYASEGGFDKVIR